VWGGVVITFGLIGLAGIVWSGFIWYAYQSTLPHHPDQVAGRVYPLNVHGVVVYQTREERDRLNVIQHFSFMVFAVGILTGALHRKKFGQPLRP
jgi:hypothetical protein